MSTKMLSPDLPRKLDILVGVPLQLPLKHYKAIKGYNSPLTQSTDLNPRRKLTHRLFTLRHLQDIRQVPVECLAYEEG